MAGNKKWMLCDWKGNIVHVLPLGRFKTDTRLCLSISDYHPDTWNPAWSVSTILTGIHFVSGESNYEVTFSFCRTVELHAGEKSNPWLSGNVRLWEEAVCSEARSQQSWMKTVTLICSFWAGALSSTWSRGFSMNFSPSWRKKQKKRWFELEQCT